MANSLVFLSSDKTTPLTSTVIIAKALNRDVGDINKIVIKYKSHIEAFGMIMILNQRHIKMPNGGYKTVSDYYLNEIQATFLITLLRNSPKVLDFKLALVKAFFEMRQQLQLQNQPKTDSLPNYYTADQIKELKDKARRQGYAIACQYLKKDENGLTPFDRKELQKALTVLEWLDSKRIDMHNAWKEQREIARQLRELTYKYEQSSDILSLMFGGYVGTASEVSHYLTDKLKQDS